MSETAIRLLFLSHLAATLYMVGVIWIVQIVHYPLMSKVGTAEFPAFEAGHQNLIFRVVALPMLVEGGTAVCLIGFPLHNVEATYFWLGAMLLGVIWWSTVWLQIPCHNSLAREFSHPVHRKLVATNWLRTVAWTLRGLLVLWILWDVVS